MEIRKVCVLGAGLMGSGITQVCAQAGYRVAMRDIEQRFIDGGMNTITRNLTRDVEKGKKTREEADAILKRITPALDLREAASDADLVVEAVVEDMDIKKRIFVELEEVVSRDCLFFSNTSGLSITELASVTKRPDRFIGTHFFNPVPVMRLLEIIRGYETSDETLEIAKTWGKKIGKLILRAPWLTDSYFKDPERTKDLWKDGWLYTGDVAYIDSAGYIQITDRTKDVIKTGGEWISSLELENLISLHDAVLEAAAIGMPDPKWGERPLLIVVLRPEYKDKVTQDDLKNYMMKFADEGKIPKYGVPDKYLFVDGIPKTSVGKINKIQLRKLYG